METKLLFLLIICLAIGAFSVFIIFLRRIHTMRLLPIKAYSGIKTYSDYGALYTVVTSGVIGDRTIKFEASFKKYMKYWTKTSIDTTRSALISLQLLNDDKFIDENKEIFIKFFNTCFDKQKGGYTFVPNNNGDKVPSIYSTSNAIDVLHKIDEKVSTDKINLIKKFLKTCVKKDSDFTYLYDNSVGEKQKQNNIHDISTLYLTKRLIEKLNNNGSDKIFDLVPEQ